MEGILILVGVSLGIVLLLSERHVGHHRYLGESFGDVGSSRMTDGFEEPPISLRNLAGIDAVGKGYGLDNDLPPIDSWQDMKDPFGELTGDVRDAGCLSETWLFDEMNSPVGINSTFGLIAHSICINPATGLPMVGDNEAGFDVGGNLYGFNNDDLYIYSDSFDSGIGMHSVGLDNPLH